MYPATRASMLFLLNRKTFVPRAAIGGHGYRSDERGAANDCLHSRAHAIRLSEVPRPKSIRQPAALPDPLSDEECRRWSFGMTSRASL
jgi:hypothetical protein